MDKQKDKLIKLAKPVADYLQFAFKPNTTVVISSGKIRIEETVHSETTYVKDNLREVLEKLDGINAKDWNALARSMEHYFKKKASESYQEIKLTDTREIESIIRSQFGLMLD